MLSVFDREENIGRKRENACYQHFGTVMILMQAEDFFLLSNFNFSLPSRAVQGHIDPLFIKLFYQ